MEATEKRAAGDAASVRLFFALWPDEQVRAALGALTARLARRCGGRATASANLHVTLAFLGNVPQRRRDDFIAIGDGMRGAPFDLQLDTVGYWRHNRIVWAGARTAPGALAALAAAFRQALADIAWPVDDRPYAPHVTLIRDARDGPGPEPARLPRWHVEDFALVKSEQTAGRVAYTPIRRWPLEAPDG
jgi:RNA 2',3'-cyclic 3'-phosphodiesterase